MNHNSRNCFLLALGGNGFDDPVENARVLEEAFGRLTDAGFAIVKRSRLWRTPAFPAGAGPDFVNACGQIDADLSPEAALRALHAIEAAMGRVRTLRWGQRLIDLDLLAMGNAILPDKVTWRKWCDLPQADQQRLAPDRLILPHPRLHERGFALVPLDEVAPDWVHPVLGRSVSQMLADLPAEETVQIVTI